MRLGEDLYDIFLDLMCRHRHKLSRKDRDRDVVVRANVRPVFANHLEHPATYTVAFDSGFRHLFTDDDRHAAMDSVLVLAVFEQDRAVTDRFAVSVKITKAAVAMESVFLR